MAFDSEDAANQYISSLIFQGFVVGDISIIHDTKTVDNSLDEVFDSHELAQIAIDAFKQEYPTTSDESITEIDDATENILDNYSSDAFVTVDETTT